MASGPSKWVDRLLAWVIKGELLEELLGDLHEYHSELQELPSWKRNLTYWFQAINVLRPTLTRSLFGTRKLTYLGMTKLNFKIAVRSIIKHRSISIPSLVILVFGTISFQFIHSWFDNELRMDEFHSKFDRIYMGATQTNPMADLSPISPQMMFQLDYDKFPEIDKQLLIHIYNEGEIRVTAQGTEYSGKALIADSTFFSFFDFPIQKGDKRNLLNDPSHIVLSGNFANRIFGNANPIGQMVKVSCDQEGLYKVAAVTSHIPSNSSIEFDFIVPRHSQRFWRRIPMDLVLAKEGFDVVSFNSKVGELGRSNLRFPESIISFIPISSSYFDHSLDVSLFGKFGNGKTVDTLMFVGMLICFITILGFNNLQSTKQLSSSDQLGIKQMIGSTKWQLCTEMIMERFIYIILAVVTSLLLFEALFPYYLSAFNQSLSQRPIFDLLSISVVVGIITLFSILISASQIYGIDLKNTVIGTKNPFRIPRMQRSITTIQYSVTMIMIIATAVVLMQYRFMSSKDTGFDHKDVVSVDFFEISSNQNQVKSFERVKSRLSTNPSVAAFSQGDLPVDTKAFLSSWKKANEDEYESHKVMNVGPGYDAVLGIELLEGRFFTDSLDQSGQQKVVINESARKYWGIGDITEEKLLSNSSGRQELEFQIVGIVEDFHFEHLSKKIQPLVLRYRTYDDDSFLVRFHEGELQSGIAFLESLFHGINPSSPFNYELLGDKINMQYEKEKQLGKIYTALTIVALILSSISLFTFSLYETKRRTKEIGIRKVNGASCTSIFKLLTFSFLRTVAIAFFIALPFAWYFSHQWIQEFAYRASVGWWIFAAAGLVASLFALIAIASHVLMISRQNPIESLRYE